MLIKGLGNPDLGIVALDTYAACTPKGGTGDLLIRGELLTCGTGEATVASLGEFHTSQCDRSKKR